MDQESRLAWVDTVGGHIVLLAYLLHAVAVLLVIAAAFTNNWSVVLEITKGVFFELIGALLAYLRQPAQRPPSPPGA